MEFFLSLLSGDSRLAWLSSPHGSRSVALRRFSDRYFTMAQWAMLELEIVEFTFERLMLASFARVVLLRKNRLSTGNARTEMAAAFSTIYVTKKNLIRYRAYYSVMRALQSFLGQLNSFFALSMGGCLENRFIASISYDSLSLSVISGSRSSLTKAFEQSL